MATETKRPGGGPLDGERRRMILESVRARQDEERISNRELGLIVGCSAGTWSQVAGGKYPGAADKFILRAEQWLRDRSGRAATPDAIYCDTSVGLQMMAVCTRAWQLSRLGLILARAGVGKTMVLSEFARRRGRYALYIRVGELINTKTGLLWELVRRLGLTTRVGTSAATDELGQAVREHLAASYQGGKGTPFCILVDEATRIKAAPMSLLRDFSDDPACRAAVVLAGTWELDVLLRKSSWIPGGTDQVRSRLAAVYALRQGDPVPAEDVESVARSILARSGFAGTLHRDAIKYLVDVANGDGALRAVENRLYAVRDAAEACGARPTYSVDELDYVATMLRSTPLRPHTSIPFHVSRPAPAAGAA